LNEVSFVFAQVFALKSVLKLSFLLVVLITSFGDVAKMFIVLFTYFSYEKMVGYLPNCLLLVLK
jgi:hypothetical protein